MNFKNTVGCSGTEGGFAVFYVVCILMFLLCIAIFG